MTFSLASITTPRYASQLLPQIRLLGGVHPVNLENVFRRIHPNSANMSHGRPPLSEIYNDLILARLMPSEVVHTNRSLTELHCDHADSDIGVSSLYHRIEGESGPIPRYGRIDRAACASGLTVLQLQRVGRSDVGIIHHRSDRLDRGNVRREPRVSEPISVSACQ
jgi:hypothetical protein